MAQDQHERLLARISYLRRVLRETESDDVHETVSDALLTCVQRLREVEAEPDAAVADRQAGDARRRVG
jgi:hypothetical protein